MLRAMPRCWTCGSANVLSIVLIDPHGTPALLRAAIQCAEVFVRVRAANVSLSTLRLTDRFAVVSYAGFSSSSGSSRASQQRFHRLSPAAALLMWPALVGMPPVGMLVG